MSRKLPTGFEWALAFLLACAFALVVYAAYAADTVAKPTAVEGVATQAAKAGESPPVQVEQTGSQVYVLIITSAFTFLGVVVTSIMTYFVHKLNVTTQNAAVVAVETKKTVDAVHHLVNSNMRIALEANAILARRLADLTRKTADKHAADLAEEKVIIHDKAQAEIDAVGKKA